ncbi:S-layer homology domain-containing protein [Paenibacillus sp. GCM10027626]|uniref:S-layer homology domain-containing protein n=1 Tax=Paenibacillus sp. GCM10027626 TaxID=3273411 RepID=UPI003640AD35
MAKRNKRKQRWLVTISAAVALTSVVPVAYADKAVTDPRVSVAVKEGAESTMPADPGSAAPVKATITKEKAVALAKNYVSIPDDYKLQSVNLYTTSGEYANNKNVWNLTFVKMVNGKHKGSIDTSIDADNGSLIGFSSYIDDPGAKPSYPLKVDRAKADEIAQSFIAKISPKLKGQIQADADYGAADKPPLNGQFRHSLRYNRVIDGLPFMENYIMVDVDSEGRVLSYNVSWNENLKITPLKPGISKDEALAKIKASLKPELAYYIPYAMKQPRKPQLAYEMPALSLDAVTGQVKEAYDRSSQLAEKPIADKALGSKPAAAKNLTREEAEKIVRGQFAIPANAVEANSSYNEYKDENTGITTSSWNISWTIKDGDKEIGSVHASVDSNTGFINSFNSYNWEREQNNKSDKRIAYKDARNTAVELVKKQLPWLADQLYMYELGDEEIKKIDEQQYGNISFQFVRKVAGARVDYDNVNVSVDAYTGEVRDFYASVSPFEYASKLPAVIDRDKAVAAWMDYYKLELTYVSETQYRFNGQPIPIEKYNLMLASGDPQVGKVEADSQFSLVYRLVPKPIDEGVYLDAQTGEWRNRETGERTSLEKPHAADIEGHWAQRELQLMVDYKALDVVDGKVRPNQVITRGELIKMLVLAMNSGRQPRPFEGETAAKADFKDVSADSGYFVYVQNALQQNLIDVGDGTFNPEAKVDRGEMAELIVRALGYNPLAEHSELFKIDFKDADKTKQKGQAAIVVGLGIMSLKDGKFSPERDVTRAEAATAFFRYLSVQADLKEAPLRN